MKISVSNLQCTAILNFSNVLNSVSLDMPFFLSKTFQLGNVPIALDVLEAAFLIVKSDSPRPLFIF